MAKFAVAVVLFLSPLTALAGYLSAPQPWIQVPPASVTCRADSELSKEGWQTFSIFVGDLRVHATRNLFPFSAHQAENACLKSLLVYRESKFVYINVFSGRIDSDENFVQVGDSTQSVTVQASTLSCNYNDSGFTINNPDGNLYVESVGHWIDTSFGGYLRCNAAIAQASANQDVAVVLFKNGSVAPAKGFFHRRIMIRK